MKRTTEHSLPCKFYARGYCARGSTCFYAHNQIPLELPRFRNELASEGMPTGETKVCTNYSQGFCSKGSKCPYRHQSLPIEKVSMFVLLTLDIGPGKTD